MAIDCHAHYVPPQMIDALGSRARDFGLTLHHAPGCQCAVHFENGVKLRPFFNDLVESKDARLKAMDATGVDRQVLSSWTDLYAPHLDVKTAIEWHAFLNEHLRRVRDETPHRFSYLASMPLPHAEASASLLENEVKQHGAVGAVIPANVLDTNLGELDLEAFWQAAERLDVGVFLHPVQAVPQPRSAKFGLTQVVQYTTDTSLTVGSLMMSGVLDRYPRLRILLSHGGGSVPYLIGRFDIMHARMNKAHQANVAKEKPSAYLLRFYYDSIVHDPSILSWLATRVSIPQLVLGSDYSFPPADRDPVKTVMEAGFSADECGAILERNAHDLFPALPA